MSSSPAPLPYTLVRSGRKTIGMEIKDGALLVRAPYFCPKRRIEKFIEDNRAWAERALLKAQKAAQAEKLTEEEIDALKKRARTVMVERVAYYAPRVGERPERITIRCQKTKWGSCSGRRNVNFNCLLLLMPPEVIDAVVVHELCHLRHMNHSAEFYGDVELVYPEYRKWNAYLKEHGPEIMARVK